MPKIFNVNALTHSFSCSKKSLQQYFKDVIKKITFQQYFKDTIKKKKKKKSLHISKSMKSTNMDEISYKNHKD